jgi:magnesium chelatase subunit I
MTRRPEPQTLAALKAAEIRPLAVKDEIRNNLVRLKGDGADVFQGIVGYENSVIPQIENALLAKHDFLLLGLRGQAKTRLLRQLVGLLNEWVPVVQGCPIHDDPYAPRCKRCRRLAEHHGDDLPVAWLHRERRYNEKLATPDVTIADLIGDVDPLKAARDRLTFADEEVIHYGVVPRTHRGIFAINELPDLQPRIQVGLLNILEEKDFQIRGFPVRLPVDVLMVFSANPEDYTNRGNIITPLKDRIASQILTHYPETLEESIRITDQEAWIARGVEFRMPGWYREIIEQVAFEARRSEYVDQNSGVSARLAISAYENLVSNLERRALLTGQRPVFPRIVDLQAMVPAISGKIELVYEGEQQGADTVARHIVGEAVKRVFLNHFPRVAERPRRRRSALQDDEREALETPPRSSVYDDIVSWFSAGKRIEVSDAMPEAEYVAQLRSVDGLEGLARKTLPQEDEAALGAVMEFVLEGLYQHSFVAKESVERSTFYSDMLLRMFDGLKQE